MRHLSLALQDLQALKLSGLRGTALGDLCEQPIQEVVLQYSPNADKGLKRLRTVANDLRVRRHTKSHQFLRHVNANGECLDTRLASGGLRDSIKQLLRETFHVPLLAPRVNSL